MRFLMADEIVEMNRVLVRDSGEPHAVMFRGNLDFVVHAHSRVRGPRNAFYRAAILLQGLSTTHVFAEGNKRTAITACDVFLRRHGFRISTSPGEVVEFALRVSLKSLPVPDVHAWLLDHSATVK